MFMITKDTQGTYEGHQYPYQRLGESLREFYISESCGRPDVSSGIHNHHNSS
jgi:hypothetical protein